MSQLGYTITNECNKLQDYDIDCVIFTEEIRPINVMPQFAIMNISEVYDQPGLTIATTPSTVKKLEKCWAPNYKIFYNWDLYWLRGRQKIYAPMLDLYHTPLDIIARSESHKKLIENCFNIKVKSVIENFDILQIIKLYEENNVN